MVPRRFLKHCRAIVISQEQTKIEFQQNLAGAGIFNVSHSLPSAISTGISLRTKLDLYLYLAGDLSQAYDFDCIQRLRRSNDPNVAFAPMMLVAERLTPTALKAAINAGFDDILLQPVGAGELHARIIAAITSPHTFYVSHDYAGPDRRRGLLARAAGPDRRSRSARASRLIVERSITAGCRVRRAERLDAADGDPPG